MNEENKSKRQIKKEQTQENTKDALKVAEKGAATYLGGPAGAAAVNALHNTPGVGKAVNKVEDRLAKTLAKNKVIGSAANKLGNSGITKKADQGLDAYSALGGGGAAGAAKGASAAGSTSSSIAGKSAGASKAANNVNSTLGKIPGSRNESTENPDQQEDYSKRVGKAAIKSFKVIQLMAPLIPFIAVPIILFLVVILVMAQTMVMRDKVNAAAIQVSTGVEKYINFMSGNGWKTEEEIFYQTLEERYNESVTLPTENGEVLYLDVPLIAATVNYSKITDTGLYEDQNDENLGEYDDGSAESAFGQFFAGYLQNNQMRNFYYVANDKLGNFKSLLPGNRRLIGHMIGYKIVWKDVSYITDAGEIFSKWTEFLGFLLDSVSNDYEQIYNVDLGLASFIPVVGDIQRLYGAIKLFKKILAYDSMGENHDGYFQYQMRGFHYELEELIVKSKGFSDSEVVSGLEDGSDVGFFEGLINAITTVPTPYVYFYETLDKDEVYNYGHYLREVYMPGTFFSQETYIPTRVEGMVREVYEQREYYEYLVGDLGSPGANGNVNCDDCSYDLSNVVVSSGVRSTGSEYSNMNNIKVRLVGWYDDRGAEMETDIPFEKYILGVVYAEVDGYNDEAQKAQSVAARAFALTRPFEMGNSQYCNWKKSGDGWILTLRGSTADQVYCDPEQGCSSISRDFNWHDTYSGTTTKPNKYKDAIPADAAIRTSVASTAGQVAVNSEGYIVLADFAQSAQSEWQELGKTKKYTDFLPNYYTSKLGYQVTIGEGNCSKSSDDACNGAMSGDWAGWRQFDPAWGDKLIGDGSISKLGCAATAVSIQLARSGVSTTFNPINPGTFVDAYKAAGGFSGNSIHFDQVNKVAPTFKYVGRESLSGSDSAKFEKVKSFVEQGYYLVMEVKKGNNSGQHWVAVVTVKDNVIIMADPASSETDAVSKYGTGLSEFVYYKVG